tara:strand:- start:1660 stop:2172 length:513 start_codon:yes stop_codon:yes gene_type:complete
MILLVQNISLKIIKKDNKCYRRNSMKKTELKTIIREIVREEVRMELRKFLKESKRVKLKQKPLKKKASATPAVYTKNKVLNKVLNETANAANEWETLGDKTLTTDSMQSILQKSYAGMMTSPDNSNMIDSEMVSSTGVSSDQMPDYVKSALTRDYSELMGAIDKKKNGVK